LERRKKEAPEGRDSGRTVSLGGAKETGLPGEDGRARKKSCKEEHTVEGGKSRIGLSRNKF